MCFHTKEAGLVVKFKPFEKIVLYAAIEFILIKSNHHHIIENHIFNNQQALAKNNKKSTVHHTRHHLPHTSRIRPRREWIQVY